MLEVEGDAGGGRARSSRGCRARRRRWRASSASRAPDARRAPASAGFAIVASARGGAAAALVAPDAATCDDCLRELLDPADRRYRYPFVNCTNCGPRFTIVRGVPYDRPRTTMAGFAMCAACRAEYEDPRDRRFHAAAERLPGLRPARAAGRRRAPAAAATPSRAAAALLRAGAIVAVKGLGGYHLACRADDEAAVARAARAQAPRGQAVRADGRATSPRRARSSSSTPADAALLTVARRGRSCSPRGAPGARGRRRGRARARASSA